MTAELTGYAPLRSRYGAFLIDVLFCLVLWFMGALMTGSIGLEFNRWNGIALAAAYFGLLPATPLQATPGKLAFRIRIVDLQGNRLSILRSLARFAASIPSVALLGLGFVVAAWTLRRQTLHDVLAGTLVVGLGDVPREVAPPLSWLGRAAAFFVVVSSAAAVYANIEIYHAILKREACMRGNPANAAACAARGAPAAASRGTSTSSP